MVEINSLVCLTIDQFHKFRWNRHDIQNIFIVAIVFKLVELICTILLFYKTQLNCFRFAFVQVALSFYWMLYNTIAMDVLSCRRWEMVSFSFSFWYTYCYLFFFYSLYSYSLLLLINIGIGVLFLLTIIFIMVVLNYIKRNLFFYYRWGCAMHWFSTFYFSHYLYLFTIVTAMNIIIM